MERDSLALFISMLSFIFSVFYFLSFYAFRNSNIFKYDNQYVYLSRDNTFLCDDVKDKNTCKQPFYSNNMLNLGENNSGNNLFLNKNAQICDDVNKPETCHCLSNKCDFLRYLSHFTFIDKPTAFSTSKYGMMYGARALPFEYSNKFSFASWININFVDSDKWRSIFMWRKSKTEINPAILVSPRNWSSCNSQIDIRFSSLYDKSDFNPELNGTFNYVNGNHGHCISSTTNHHYKWFHLTIVGNEKLLTYYINGDIVDEVKLERDFELGSLDDSIYIGGSPEYSSEGIILAKTRWFSKPLSKAEINNLVNEPYE